jgi:tRNA 2-selenouridine synthase
MKPTITYEEVVEEGKKKKNIGFVDVRSPKEYEFSTIPGAVNIPVLDNESRATVGTLYVDGQVEKAKQYGVDWAASQLPGMYTHYQELLNQYDEIVIFCSRGGMRSNSIFSLLKALGLPVSRLSGGYKAYRHYINERLDTELTKVNFVTLYGLSGSGKTEILKELAKKGANILDLEGCANHRGSMLGSIGLSAPHSQKAFESLLFDASQDWQEGDIVYTEGESKRIGNVVIPTSLFAAIKEGKKLYIDAPLELRVAQIHRDYVKEDNQKELSDSLGVLKAFINEERVNLFQEQVVSGDVDLVIESLLVSYYDPRYNHHKSQRDLTLVSYDAKETAENILKWQKESEQN